MESGMRAHACAWRSTPDVRGREPVFVVLVANKGKVRELTSDVMTGAEVKPSKAQVGAR